MGSKQDRTQTAVFLHDVQLQFADWPQVQSVLYDRTPALHHSWHGRVGLGLRRTLL